MRPPLARLAQPVEQLALVAVGRLLGLAQRVELLAREEVGVAADDLRLLRDLLLADAHRAPLLGALEEVALRGGTRTRSDCGRRRRSRRGHCSRLARRVASRQRPGRPARNGFDSTSSARPRSCATSAVPVTSAAGTPAARSSSRSRASRRPGPRWTSRRTTSGRSAATAARASVARRGLADAKPLELEVHPAQEPQRRVVVDDEDRGTGAFHRAERVDDARSRSVRRGRAAAGSVGGSDARMSSLTPRTGTGERYAVAMGELWSGLARTLARLDRLAAEPEQLSARRRDTRPLRRLQYALHTASEQAYGLVPPAGAEPAHAELAVALGRARATRPPRSSRPSWTAARTRRPLVHEWRGRALPRAARAAAPRRHRPRPRRTAAAGRGEAEPLAPAISLALALRRRDRLRRRRDRRASGRPGSSASRRSSRRCSSTARKRSGRTPHGRAVVYHLKMVKAQRADGGRPKHGQAGRRRGSPAADAPVPASRLAASSSGRSTRSRAPRRLRLPPRPRQRAARATRPGRAARGSRRGPARPSSP